MFVTIINDCKDDNAMGRQATRVAQLFCCPVNTVGVDNDLEAAGNLIDMLDAGGGEEGVILVNVAPRHKEAKKWPNGTPFGYFFWKKTLVVSSIDGLTLSLVKKFNLTDKINLMDIPDVLGNLKEQGVVSEDLESHITHTQFRSFEFIPRVGKWLIDGIKIPTDDYSISEIADAPNAIWWVDNFGNCKTTLLPEDINFKAGKKIKLAHVCHSDPAVAGEESDDLELECFERLKDVPDETPALIIGSSGLEEKRFIELIIQGVSASDKYKIKSGYKFNF